MEPKDLPGVAPDGIIEATDDAGNIVDPIKAIFPILKQNSSGIISLVGTGFFITNTGIFATAKHVMEDVYDESGNQKDHAFIIQFFDGKYTKRPILRCTNHPIADISIGCAAPMTHRVSGEQLTNNFLKLSQSVPEVGSKVFTYAYPRTTIMKFPVQDMHFYADYFEGQIEEHYPNGRDRSMLPGPCTQTSMYIHGAASGGPVFHKGKAFAVNSTGYDGDALSFITPVHTCSNLLLSEIIIQGKDAGDLRVGDLLDVCSPSTVPWK